MQKVPKITEKHFLIVYIMQNGQKTNFNRCKVWIGTKALFWLLLPKITWLLQGRPHILETTVWHTARLSTKQKESTACWPATETRQIKNASVVCWMVTGSQPQNQNNDRVVQWFPVNSICQGCAKQHPRNPCRWPATCLFRHLPRHTHQSRWWGNEYVVIGRWV